MSELTLAQKLLIVQSKIRAVTKSATNPHFKSRYADLNEVLDVAKEALNIQGIFISQAPGANEFGKYLETSLIDGDSGQQIQGRVFFSGTEDNMQKIGAAITYARRFGLVSLLALESEDDDGETAVGRGNGQAARSNHQASQGGASAAPSQQAPSGASKVPVQNASNPGASKKTTLEKISLTSKVLVDSKRCTQDEVIAMLQSYGVKTKDELKDDQAQKLLAQLEGKLNAK